MRAWHVVLVLGLSLSFGAVAKELILIHITDTHIVTEWDPDKKQGVSVARAATRIQQIQRENPDAAIFLVHSGDFISPSSTSRVHQGADVVELLNALGVDIATIGNHEFDYGAKILKQRLKETAFPVTVANVFEGEENLPFAELPPYVVIEKKGIRVAFVGVVTQETTLRSARKLGDPVSISDPAQALERAYAAVRQVEPKVDFVVALTHLEHDEDRAVLALKRLPNIILGGHEHMVREEIHGDSSPYKKGLNDLEDLRTIHFKLDETTGRWKRTREVYELLDRSIPEAAEIAALSARHKAQMDEQMNRVVGRFPKKLDGTWKGLAESLREGGAELPDFVAGVLAKQLRVDISLFNVGTVSRSDQEYPEGPVTYGTLQQLYPYKDPFVIVTASGEAIRGFVSRCVDRGLSRDDASWFTPLPALGNARARWSREKPEGERLLSLEIGGAPVEKDLTYRFAVNRFLYEHDAFLKNESTLVIPLNEAVPEFESLVEGIRTQFPAEPCEEQLAP